MIAWLKAWLKRHNKLIEQLTAVSVAVVAAFIAVMAVRNISVFENMDRFLSDFVQGALPHTEPQDPDVVVVAVTEDTLAQLPYRAPLDRGFLATVVAKIAASEPRAIAIDYLLDQPTEPAKDDLLKKTLLSVKAPLVVAYTSEKNVVTERQTQYLDSYVLPKWRGDVHLRNDELNVVRWLNPGQVMDGKFVPGFARAVASRLKPVAPFGPDTLIVWRGEPPRDAEGKAVPAFKEYQAHFVPFLPSAWFKNKVVLIGSDITLTDRHLTPFNVVDQGDKGNMAGVLIQANAVSQLLHGRTAPKLGFFFNVLIVFFCAAGGAWLGQLNVPLWARAMAGLGFVVVIISAGVGVYVLGGALASLVTPSLAMGLSLWATESLTGREAKRQRHFIQGAFSKYVSPKVVEQLVADPSRMSLEGERRVMTFLFTDIENFTTMSESIDSRELGHILNPYLEGMTQCALKHDGMVDKFIGDAVMAIFNAPLDVAEHEEKAVRCALAMDRFSYDYHRKQNERGIALGITRIGVHTGPAVIGNFGSLEKFNYTAQGDTVNIASRLEGLNKHFHTRIAVSDETRKACRNIVFRPIGEVVLKGKTKAIEVWEPLQDHDPRLRYVAAYEEVYAKLRDNAPDAAALLEKLLKEHPEDPCLLFHKARVDRGEKGVLISMTEK